MTTVAFDGRTMAADTLATDSWGMKERVDDKILRGQGFLVGTAGQNGAIKRWWAQVCQLDLEHVLDYGYPSFDADRDDPAIMLTNGRDIWRHVTGGFFHVSRGFHAVGSGRDYALAAMHLGKSAEEAVRIAMEFDHGTGGDVLTQSLHELPAITDAEQVDFIAAGACVVLAVLNGVDRWRCLYDIDRVGEGGTMREAIDDAIRAQ
jgi:hypothetical protein